MAQKGPIGLQIQHEQKQSNGIDFLCQKGFLENSRQQNYHSDGIAVLVDQQPEYLKALVSIRGVGKRKLVSVILYNAQSTKCRKWCSTLSKTAKHSLDLDAQQIYKKNESYYSDRKEKNNYKRRSNP